MTIDEAIRSQWWVRGINDDLPAVLHQCPNCHAELGEGFPGHLGSDDVSRLGWQWVCERDPLVEAYESTIQPTD